MVVRAEAILPKTFFDVKLLHRDLGTAARKVSSGIQKDFAATYETFSDKPTSEQQVQEFSDRFEISVIVTSEKYAWLVFGTGPRDIVAKGWSSSTQGGTMKFQTGYVAKTTPAVIGAGQSKRFGTWVATPIVRDHKVEARKFDTVIAEKWQRSGDLRTGMLGVLQRFAEKFTRGK